MKMHPITIAIAEHAGENRGDVFKKMVADIFPDFKSFEMWYCSLGYPNLSVVYEYLDDAGINQRFYHEDAISFVDELMDYHDLPQFIEWEDEIKRFKEM
jgi:hypothetical protein